MAKARKTGGMLRGNYGLGEMARKSKDQNLWVHLGVMGAGAVLGYVSFPYHQTPLGMTLMGAAGSVMAVGLLLLVYDVFRDKNVLQVTG